MRSLQIPRFGPPEVLRIVTGSDPHPGDGEVLVAVEYSGMFRRRCDGLTFLRLMIMRLLSVMF